MPLTSEYPDSYQPLCDQLTLHQGLNYTPQWSAAADFLSLMLDCILTNKPQYIVECSSGLTTLILARACQINGTGHIMSLENGSDYAVTTRQALQAYGLEAYATIVDAPLIPHDIGATRYQWYQHERLLNKIDLLVIDGPPGFIQPWSRYPALPLLMHQFNPNSTILLDDAGREDEISLVEKWCQQWPNLSHTFIPTERGCSILRRIN